MNWFYGAVVLLVALLLVVVIRTFAGPSTEQAASRLAIELGLPLTTDVAPFVIRHVAARNRAFALGTLAGALAGCGIAPLLSHRIDYMVIILIGFEVIAATSALCIVSLSNLESSRSAGIARAAAVSFEDYISPAHRVLVGVVIAAAIVLVFVASRMRGLDPTLCVALLLTITTFVVAEVAGRRLVAQRQPANTDVELAWNDALRAQLVWDLYGSPLGLGAGTVVLSIMSIEGTHAAFHYLPFLSIALTILGATGAAILRRLRLDRYVLRRLWPERVKAGWY